VYAAAVPIELDATVMPTVPAPATPATTPVELDVTATSGGAPLRSDRDRELRAGDLLAHFRIDRRLGVGGMGEVWLATDMALDRPVAIKVLPPEVARDASRRERLFREARAQARIHHPNVCHIYYVGEERGIVFFAMEHIAGESLAERVSKGPVPVDEAIEWVRMAAGSARCRWPTPAR
jgi:serine/threonine protein kinase